MPFGQKPDGAGAIVDFDAVYHTLIKPAIDAVGLEPIRADEELAGGIIHKPMYERLILSEYAVADLTTANANVFYELGIRHAVRPWSTVLLFAGQSRLPFDVAPLRAMSYKLTATGQPDDVEAAKAALVERLRDAQTKALKGADTDSPLFQLVEGFPKVVDQLEHTKTDVFREHVRYSTEMKERLARARTQGVDAVRALEQELGALSTQEAGVLVDLFLSYRAVKAWRDMIVLVEKMPATLANSVMVQEQFALALTVTNRVSAPSACWSSCSPNAALAARPAAYLAEFTKTVGKRPCGATTASRHVAYSKRRLKPTPEAFRPTGAMLTRALTPSRS
jgi:hypothetical protein